MPSNYEIKLAVISELDSIEAIYSDARAFMAANGNPTQWGRTGYPQRELLREDIRLRRLFKVVSGREIDGAFVLFIGEEPTYRVIRDGAWPDDGPYATVHRLAGRKGAHGVADACLVYAKELCREKGLGLRADTHRDNHVMQHILEKHGFRYCGVITVADGTERLAYQLNR